MAPRTSSSALNYSSIQQNKWKNVQPPPGFSKTPKKSSERDAQRLSQGYTALKERRAWDLAISPAKQLPMQAFMLYMSGSSIQIFSIGIVLMLLVSPFRAVLGIDTAFAQFAPSPGVRDSGARMRFTLQRLVYVGCNVLTLLLGLWKCRQMGLLPTGTGDWLAFETRGEAPEILLV